MRFESGKNASMWNKIYLIFLAAAILTMSGLTYLAFSNLHSTGFAPAIIAENYNYYSNIGWSFLWISAICLLIAGNIILWKARKSWALWTIFLYFALFIVLQTFWLGQLFFHYQKENRLSDDILSFSPFLGIILIVLMAIFVFFNQYLVKRMHDKMYLVKPVEDLPEETPTTENKI